MATLQSSDTRRSVFQAILGRHAAANDSIPLPMLVIFEEQMGPARLDEQGCEKTEICTLNELFSPEDAGTIENWVKIRFAPHQLCDGCGNRMVKDVPVEDWECLTPFGFKSYLIREWCEENRQSSGEEAGLPNIMAKLNPKKAIA